MVNGWESEGVGDFDGKFKTRLRSYLWYKQQKAVYLFLYLEAIANEGSRIQSLTIKVLCFCSTFYSIQSPLYLQRFMVQLCPGSILL